MSDQENHTPEGENPAAPDWEAVGKQFQVLGESLAQAIRAAWDNPRVRQEAEGMRQGVESLLSQVGESIDQAAHSEEGQKVKAEAEKAAEELRQAGEKTLEEVRPHLLSALQKANQAIQKVIDELGKP